jgi:uncharacterized protein (TIGR00730 family)
MIEMEFKRICVFCGSSRGRKPVYARIAREMARALAGRGIDLVYGGGRVGVMGVMADEMIACGREVIGVIPRVLATREVAHEGVTDLRVVRTMHERKALMAELSDGFIALPGGFGTFEELFEIVTWAQLGIHQKPIGVLNTRGYFDPLLQLIERGIEQEFIQRQHRRLIIVGSSPDELISEMARYEPIAGLAKWIELGQT